MSSFASQLIVPLALWGSEAPTHCISCIHITDDHRTLITGCNDGHICLWDVDTESLSAVRPETLTPRCMCFGHTAPVLCLASGRTAGDAHLLVSSSESGFVSPCHSSPYA